VKSTTTADLAELLARLAQELAEARQNAEPEHEPRTADNRVLLTVEEAAQRLGIGRSLAFRLVRTGEIESVQIGRLRRIHVSAIDRYAEKLAARQPKKIA